MNYGVIPYDAFIKEKEFQNKIIGNPRTNGISSIILHHTNLKSKEEYLKNSLDSGFLVHFLVGKDGKYYGWSQSTLPVVKAVPKMDAVSLHISLEGSIDSILQNKKQLGATGKLLMKLTNDLDIPFSNYDIESKLGVFTHTQAKKKFGNFIDLKECGSEKILKYLMQNYGGKFYSEDKWKNRHEKDWIVRKENATTHNKSPFDRGREITKQNKIELKELEKDKHGFTPNAYRLKYVYNQSIKPTCIVLHFTAIASFAISQETLEKRKLSSSIMVDKDAKAYQLLDSLEDMAQAATGTNQNCIQIEIVGKNTPELLSNKKQIGKVARLVKELAKTYKIPLTNHKIEGLKGIYSHTQAKKKFGGSVALNGKDFDPGEPYMKNILNSIGGKYYNEKDWFNRKSDDWIVLDQEFQP